MAYFAPNKIGTWLEITLRIAGAYVVLTSIGFAIWKTTGADAGVELVALLAGFVIAAIVLLVGGIVEFCRRDSRAGALALVFVVLALISAWSVLSRLARAEN